MGNSTTTSERVQKIAEPVVAREGFELIDTQFVTERGRTILRLFVDTIPPGDESRGIGVDDCALISRVVGDLLDVEDTIDGEYTLEVSSPGLFRPLTKPAHFDRVMGQRVKVKTFKKIDGRKVFTGTLSARDEDTLTVEVDGTAFQVTMRDVAKANLEPLL